MEERRLRVLEAYNAVTEQLATIKAKAETAALYNAQMKICEYNFINGTMDITDLSMERSRRSGAVTAYEQARVALHNSIILLEMLTNVKLSRINCNNMDIAQFIANFIYRIRYWLLWGTLIITGIVIYFTQFLPFSYTVEGSLYAGVTNSTSLDGSSANLISINSTFDNLVGIAKSRGTLEKYQFVFLQMH